MVTCGRCSSSAHRASCRGRACAYIHAGPDYIRHNRPPPTKLDEAELVDPFLISPSGSANNPTLGLDEEWQEPDTQATFKVLALGDTAKISVKFPQSSGEGPICFGEGGGGAGGQGGGGMGGAAGSGGTSGAGGSAGQAGGSGVGGASGQGGSGGTSGASGQGGSAGAGAGAGMGGAAGTGGAAGMSGSAGSGAPGSDTTDAAGCSCALPRANRASSLGWLGLLALGLRRRLRRTAPAKAERGRQNKAH